MIVGITLAYKLASRHKHLIYQSFNGFAWEDQREKLCYICHIAPETHLQCYIANIAQ